MKVSPQSDIGIKTTTLRSNKTADQTVSVDLQRKRQRRLLSYFLESIQEINEKFDDHLKQESPTPHHNRDGGVMEDKASRLEEAAVKNEVKQHLSY